MNFKKKAIEPIVATILLVVVAVILVTIVLAWGKNFTTGGLDEANNLTNDSCAGATISLQSCDWNSTSEVATLLIKNTSSTYTIAADDLSCNVTDDSNALNNHQTIPTATTAAILPGASISTTCTASSLAAAATKVTVNVRSETCPTTAVSEIKGCS
ncbi:MAG TPA: hypothetical protein PLK55_00015 [archaeon]|jgi:hypothetical protein|nr:hypothetical protein [archaeon]